MFPFFDSLTPASVQQTRRHQKKYGPERGRSALAQNRQAYSLAGGEVEVRASSSSSSSSSSTCFGRQQRRSRMNKKKIRKKAQRNAKTESENEQTKTGRLFSFFSSSFVSFFFSFLSFFVWRFFSQHTQTPTGKRRASLEVKAPFPFVGARMLWCVFDRFRCIFGSTPWVFATAYSSSNHQSSYSRAFSFGLFAPFISFLSFLGPSDRPAGRDALGPRPTDTANNGTRNLVLFGCSSARTFLFGRLLFGFHRDRTQRRQQTSESTTDQRSSLFLRCCVDLPSAVVRSVQKFG